MFALLAVEIPYWGQSLLRVLGGLVAVLLPAGTIVYLFLFKMMSFMQSRLGPMEAGPYGSLQLVAEVGKWLQKEDIQPESADKPIFKMAPIVVLMSTFLLVVVVPFGPDAWFTDFETGVFYALAVSSISVLGILMAGWSSANKYSLLGGLRAAGQLIAYELPMVLAVMGVVIQAGTMNLQQIVFAQNAGSMFGFDGIGNPYVGTFRHANRRIGIGLRLHDGVLGLPLPHLLYRRVCNCWCFRHDRKHALPWWLGRSFRMVRLDIDGRCLQLDEHCRPNHCDYQDAGAHVPHHVGALHLSTFP
jgi:hypothetical protein